MQDPSHSTGLEIQAQHSWSVRVIAEGTPERLDVEQAIVGRAALPFASRAAVGSLPEFTSSAFVALLNPLGEYVSGFAVQCRPAPLLWRQRLLRVEQFGSSVPRPAIDTMVAALCRWVRSDPRVLRFSVDVFSFYEEQRIAISQSLQRHGLRRAEHPSGYVETLVIDLAPSEEELFGSLHHSARRKIRQLAKHPVVVRPVSDPALAERLNDLLQQTLARTGGRFYQRDWRRRIELSNAHPQISRIVGLFRTDESGPDSLLAYAWGCHGGDHAFYSEAASTRDSGEVRMPLAYGVMWDLIVWAKRTGARWFDLGGITHGSHGGEDRLGGISDFKRYFSQRVLRVRDEWILDNHSWRARLAAAVHRRIRGGLSRS
jgi:hypothetical protein